jgi:LPXTG-motif cell wall-anchored protein
VLAAVDVTVLAGPALAATGAETDGLALAVLLLALGALGLWWRRRAVNLAR